MEVKESYHKTPMPSKTLVEVGCAVISGSRREPESRGRILIAQRKPGDSFGGFWEFPGGQLENGEQMEACLAREVREELGILISPRLFLGTVDHAYPAKTFRLHFYLCDWIHGKPVRHDCLNFRWVLPAELHRYSFPRADTDLILHLLRHQSRYFPV